jgi:hypothetical protein
VGPFLTGVFLGTQQVTVVVGLEWASSVVQVTPTGDELHLFDVFCKLFTFVHRHQRTLSATTSTAHIVYKTLCQRIPTISGSLCVLEPEDVLRETVLEAFNFH